MPNSTGRDERGRDLAEVRALDVLDALRDPVLVVDNGVVAFANRAMSSTLETSAQELAGRTLASLLPNDDLLWLGSDAVAQRRFAGKREPVTLEVAGLPVVVGGRSMILLVAHDGGRMAARSLQAERMASIGTLAAGIAHEINNPLTYVALNLGFLARELSSLARELAETSSDGPVPSLDERRLDLRARVERALEALRISREGSERVATIVRDLRTFARADEESRGPVDVRRVLDSAIGIAWNEIRHRARLAKEYVDVPLVEANEARLGQVFLNLLLNATQAIPEGAAASHEIRVVVRSEARRVIVEIRDTGRGIAPENLDRVFDPFFTTKSTGVGAGLGLSICHGIVTSLGGEITVDSQLGRGSVFRVSLPAAAVQPTEEAAPSTPTPRTPRARVLVIDDEPFVTQALQRTLEGDAEVVAVTSGRDAIDVLLRDQRFDLVLCDLMMPDIAGMDVYDAIRRARPGVEGAFVFMTGGAFTLRAREFLAAVPNRSLDKPIDTDELRRLVLESRARRR